MRFIFTAGALCAIALNAYGGTFADILGGWYGGNMGSTALVTFYGTGQYTEVEYGVSDGSGQSGIERGTYTWNALTGAFTSQTTLDTNGWWGFSDVTINSVQILSAPTKTLWASTSDGDIYLDRVHDPTSPIVGSWYIEDNPQPGDLTMITFLPNGTFMSAIDPSGGGYMEFGTYTWDQGTGALSASVTATTVSGSVIDAPSFTSASVQNNALVLSSDSLNMTLKNATVPEPGTCLTAIFGVVTAILAGRRRRKSLP